jgi:predicted nucleotidyltransferase component of viral defense system
MASLDDIACMKLAAIMQRGARKDFIDLYTLIQGHKPLAVLLDLFQEKYEIDDVAPVMYSLVFFDDAENEPQPQGWNGNWDALVQSFKKWVKEIG